MSQCTWCGQEGHRAHACPVPKPEPVPLLDLDDDTPLDDICDLPRGDDCEACQ
jgi:hypothetical protein